MNDQLIKRNFEDACKRIIGNENDRVGIGTLGEKTLHAVIKHTLEPDEKQHEIKIGRFYADIVNGENIIEVQTRGFNSLRKKLAYFLEKHVVTVVYPIAQTKWIVWINPDTGEATKKRKSPKVGKMYEIFDELYKIKPFLTHPNLRMKLLFFDITEYRNLNGWSHDKKKGSSRYDRIPQSLNSIINVENVNEYRKLIPENLPEIFTAKDFKRLSGLSLCGAQISMNVLKHIGTVIQQGKKGNALLYVKNPNKIDFKI